MDLLLQANGNMLTGEINGKTNKNLKITDGKADESGISFGALLETPLGTLPTTTTLTPDGDILAGKIQSKYGAYKATAKKSEVTTWD
jgi:hypothetical protein